MQRFCLALDLKNHRKASPNMSNATNAYPKRLTKVFGKRVLQTLKFIALARDYS